MDIQARIAIIISSFNRCVLLVDALQCVGRLLEERSLETSVVIYDAGSTDGSIDAVRDFAAKYATGRVALLVAEEGEDSSFAAGLNRACDFAVRRGAVDYFFLFETDNLIDRAETLMLGVELLKRDAAVAAVGFTVRTRDGTPAGFGSPFPTVISFILGLQICARIGLTVPRVTWIGSGPPVGRYGYCDCVFTSPLLIRAEVWRTLGGMDAKRFPFSDSDLDLAFRLRDAGWKSAVIETDGVVHDNIGQASVWSATRTVHFHKARFRLLRKHAGRCVYAVIPLLFVRHIVEFCLLALNSRARHQGRLDVRRKLMREVWSGYE